GFGMADRLGAQPAVVMWTTVLAIVCALSSGTPFERSCKYNVVPSVSQFPVTLLCGPGPVAAKTGPLREFRRTSTAVTPVVVHPMVETPVPEPSHTWIGFGVAQMVFGVQ